MPRNLTIATGRSCTARTWGMTTLAFEELVDRLRKPERTAESVAEYATMTKDERQMAKDRGGFVGGTLKDGLRRLANVTSRSMLTLDADNATAGFVEAFRDTFPWKAVLYTTHGHTKESPRCRIVVPLERDVDAEEYNAIARLVADGCGIAMFDPCGFRVQQLMYWPSCPSDGEYVFVETEHDWLDPDTFLATHPGWRDITTLPLTPSEKEPPRPSGGRRAKDPRQKEGIVGAFCRAYTIEEAIAEHLQDVYAPSSVEGRYDYIPAESKAGVIVYDHVFAYSHHASDPACGQNLNAFDLVRVQRFGDLDADVAPDTPVNRLPSFRAMCDLARGDARVKEELLASRTAEAAGDFAEGTDGGNDDWRSRLSFKRSGELEDTLLNVRTILENDPALANIADNVFVHERQLTGPVPWREPTPATRAWTDADDAQLMTWLARHYMQFSQFNVRTALATVADDRRFHPVRDFLDSLPEWDGVPRIDTVFIRAFGAADTPYVRFVTGRMFMAAVRRIYEPGCKFDTMLVLCGGQGQKKSTLIRHLFGAEWYISDIKLSDTRDKTAAEQLQGHWVVEFEEMSGMQKADVETLKGFISRQDDQYRPAYARTTTHHHRQCVFFGSTNAMDGFLRDTTGNRRFWPVNTRHRYEGDPDVDFGGDWLLQFWAEAKHRAMDLCEELHMTDPEMLREAEDVQKDAMEGDERQGFIEDYLGRLIPESWAQMSIAERRDYLDGAITAPGGGEALVRRDRVCIMEIWTECLCNPRERLGRKEQNEIVAIMSHIRGWHRMERKVRFGIHGTARGWEKEEPHDEIPF